ncbi:protein of unknown function [Methanoculleus bourgensis]|uniref:4-phosphopantoate--beta-alanine ligase n=1 Tax=Methanoculleus bourgensis TaxID=83986 RepID=A0A0X3BM29_9EURY|nr:protein of unknown function [Methanoculleus bourgensis]
MIPKDHPRYRSLIARERLARCAREGVVALEGLAAHGRGEAFDYLIGERTSESALLAARTAAAMLLSARHAVISVNGNTAALAAREVAALQQASGADVEVNLFHRTDERIALITRLLEDAASGSSPGRLSGSSRSPTTVGSASPRGSGTPTWSSCRSRTGTGARRSGRWGKRSSPST